MKTGSMVTRPSWRPMLNAASSVASPRPTTGMSTAPRISKRPGSWKWPMTKASYPSRSASRALRMGCAAQRNSVSGWKMVGRIEAMDLEPDAGTGGCVEQRLQPLDVGRLLDRMDEALIPQPGGTGRFGHRLSPSVNDARQNDRRREA